MSEVPSEL
jgi:glycine cleavage system H protein